MSLVKTGFIPIPAGAEPGFDHADVYPDGSGGARIYVAHTGADRVEVLDCTTDTWLRSLPGHPGVAGVLIDSAYDLMFTSDRGAARVSIYRCSDEQLLAQADVGAHPNGLAYDSARRRLFSFNLGETVGENCTASVVDLDRKQTVIATVDLPGRPRWAAYDRATDQVYVNIREPAQILAISGESLAVTRAIDVPAAGPHGLWLDGSRLFCAADGGILAVLDRDTGRELALIELPGVPDVVMHDPVLHHLYVAIGDPGVICVADTDRLELVETVETERGAHTLGIDPARHAVYAFLPSSSGAAVYLDQS
jgi:DNA-binding beta-propeller fold protein YncE